MRFMETAELASRIRAGERAAVALACRRIDERRPGYRELLASLSPSTGRARILGITGSPGAGKSTLATALVGKLRARGERVGVVAVDPTSPFSGGALLGDRIRMQQHGGDPEVFVRSLASRGALGGLSETTADVVRVLDAWGANSVVVETMGVGQGEIDVLGVAHTVIVVVAPGMGDDIQANKAGILEIADVLVVNKADRPGADAAEQALRAALDLAPRRDPQEPAKNIVRTVATTGEGVDALLAAIDAHGAWLQSTQAGASARVERARRAARTRLGAALLELCVSELGSTWSETVERVVTRELDATEAAAVLREALRARGR